MKILLLHMRFHPDLTGTAPLVTDLAMDLVAMGDQVTVVTSMPHYGRKSIPSQYRGRLLHRSSFHGVTIWRTFVYVPPSAKSYHRSLNYLSYTLMSAVAGAISGRYDVILCVNPPITVGLSGWLAGLAWRTPLVFNVQDIWPDCLAIIGQLRNPLLLSTFQHLEKFICNSAARVTVLSEGMKQNLVSKGIPAAKVEVIPNWADADHIRPVSRENGFRKAHGATGRFVVMFAGNLGYISVLDTVLGAAKLLQHDPRFLFLIVGEGNAKPGLLKQSQELALTNVHFLPAQPRKVLPQMLGAADVSLVTLNRHLGPLNVPSKIYSIMASARPVVGAVPEDSEIARIIREAKCGIWVPPEDPQSLAEALEGISQQSELLQHYGANGRHYVEKHLDRHILTRRYHELLHRVAGPRQ